MPADVGKDAVVSFGTLAKVEAFADFFAIGSVRCSINSGNVCLTGGPKRAVNGALSRKSMMLLVALDRLLLKLVFGHTLPLG